MSNSSLPNLTSKTVPVSTDVTYVAKFDGVDWYTDTKMSIDTFDTFCDASPTVPKTTSYVVPISECDGRWFSNKGSGGTISFTLPASVEEAEVGFIIEDNIVFPDLLEIIPNASDAIIPFNFVDGDSIYGMTYGATLKLRGIRDLELTVVHFYSPCFGSV